MEQVLKYGWIAFLVSFLVFEQAFLVNYFLWIGVLLPTIFCTRLSDLKKFHGSLPSNLWCALIVFLLLSFFWGKEPVFGDFGRYLKRALYLYGFGLGTFLVFDRNRDIDSKLFTWAPLLVAAAALAQIVLFYSQHDFPGERMLGPGRLSNPIHFGVVAASVSIAALVQFRQQNRRMQLLIAAAIFVNCAAIYLCQSRGAFLALSATLIVSGLFVRRIFPALSAVFIIVVAVALLLEPSTLLERGASFRPTIWEAQLERFSQCSPLIGCGVGIDSGIVVGEYRFENPHSLYLGWLLFSGIAGLAGYLALLAILIYRGVKAQCYEWTTLLLMGATSTLTSGDNVLITPSPYWAVILIPIIALVAKLAVKSRQPASYRAGETAAPA